MGARGTPSTPDAICKIMHCRSVRFWGFGVHVPNVELFEACRKLDKRIDLVRGATSKSGGVQLVARTTEP